MADIKLDHITSTAGENYYDISFTDGDFTLTQGLETALFMSVLCEVRDDSIEVPQMRGGWAGNQLQPIVGYEQGSLLWTLYQSSAKSDNTTKAQQYIEDGLQWLIDDGIAKDIEVETNIVANDNLIVKITATRNDNTQDVSFFNLWLNTINGN